MLVLDFFLLSKTFACQILKLANVLLCDIWKTLTISESGLTKKNSFGLNIFVGIPRGAGEYRFKGSANTREKKMRRGKHFPLLIRRYT